MKSNLFLFVALFSLSLFSQSKTCSCCTEFHDDFDFWIGEWVVTNPNGQQAGTNSITKIQGGCVLLENWISATAGYTGTSTNFYNATTKQWEQLWVDNQGGSLHLKGAREGNQMILKSDPLKNAKGQSYYHQVTWTLNEDGTVRQLWETFTEYQQKTVAFDGLYTKQ